MQHVVIVGGGFAGLRAARGLRDSPVHVTLIDRTNHHLFQPLLYQVATGSLSPGEIASPLRWIFRKQKNLAITLGEVCDINPSLRELTYADIEGTPKTLSYDHLVIATGATHSYFGHDEWEKYAGGLKTIDDAVRLQRKIFASFERANATDNRDEQRRLLTFVVIGAGPTGVELAGQIVEIARRTLRREYRRFDPADTRTILLDAAPRVLSNFDDKLSIKARKSLEDMGVEVITDTLVTDIDNMGVSAGDTRIESETIVWAAGVQGSPIGALLSARTDVELDRGKRVVVEPDFSLPSFPEIRVIGDLASTDMPGVAPAAMQQGMWVAKAIDAFERRNSPPAAFRYRDKGSLATIGRHRAVAQIARLRFSGTLAWGMWLVVHLMYLVGFANRILVLVRWASSWLANGRGERALPRLSVLRDITSKKGR